MPSRFALLFVVLGLYLQLFLVEQVLGGNAADINQQLNGHYNTAGYVVLGLLTVAIALASIGRDWLLLALMCAGFVSVRWAEGITTTDQHNFWLIGAITCAGLVLFAPKFSWSWLWPPSWRRNLVTQEEYDTLLRGTARHELLA